MVGSMALKVENNLVSSHKFATQHYLIFISSMRLCWFPHLANGIDNTVPTLQVVPVRITRHKNDLQNSEKLCLY